MICPNCSAAGPDGSAECPACGVIFAKWKAKAEKSAPVPAPAPASAGSGLGGTLCLLAALGVFVYGGYRIYERRVSPPPPEPKGARIDPETYKADIQAIEKAVYDGAGSVHETAAAVEAPAARIAEAVMSKNIRNPSARDAATDVMDFAARMVGAQESLGASPTARLEFVRAWETLRAARFAPADWFHPPEAVKPGAQPDFEKAAQRMLTTAHQLKGLLDGAAGECEQFGDGEVGSPGGLREIRQRPAEDVPGQWDAEEKAAEKAAQARAGEDAERLKAWRAWVPAWRERVDQALADFPKPEEIPNELQSPYQTLVRAAQEARQPPNPGPGGFVTAAELNELYLPGKRAREDWSRGVSRWLAELPGQIDAVRQDRGDGPGRDDR
ncbi:MAG: hypothetical protein A2X36_14345 [Elusimicrobia bacterium GWA2_69_24]|nr:MAG: hypothetical protein A2X36_14345 [Elusimicrobia bacterium GWA2_69_24]HBL16574.1 hypothetical protein [Elusimicrobiota bacterium]